MTNLFVFFIQLSEIMENDIPKPFAHILLSITGQSLQVIGQGVTLISGIYFGEIIFSSSRKLIESLPKIIHRVSDGRDVKASDNIKNISEHISTEGWKVAKLSTIISGGLVLKALGSWVQRDNVVNFFIGFTS